MSGLFGGQNTNNAQAPLAALSIQTSANGAPIPIVYGTTRVTPNMVWYGDFTPIAHTQAQGGGGKGGSSSASSTTYTYTASFILALCEGPVAAVLNAFVGKKQVTPTTLFSIFTGTYPQNAWSWLTTNHPTEAIGYQGIAYAAASAYDLGNSSGMENHTFEVAGFLRFGALPDAAPDAIINDLLSNHSYGVPNAPSIGGLTQYGDYCKAAGLLLSPCYDQQQAAAQMLTELAQITNTGVYFSENQLKLVPYGDAPLTGNGTTYTPYLTVQAYFTDDDFLENTGGDPVTVKRNAIAATVSTTADAYNQVAVEYLDRSNSYNPSTVVVQDQAAIDVYGLRPMPTITAHQIATAAVANITAMLILQRAVYVRSQYEFRIGWQWCHLEPTDLVTITDTALGLTLYPVRILSIEEDESGTLTVLAEDAPPGVGSHIVAQVPTAGGYNVNQSIVPSDTNAPVIFEAPNAMTAPGLELWVAASGGANWGGCNVWASTDGSTYKKIGRIELPARHGVLTSPLAAGTDPDTTHTLAVDLTVSSGQLLGGTTADADLGNTPLWVDGEIINYSSATLTSAHHYSLGTYLRRAQKGTAGATHAIGSEVARLDDAIFKYPVAADRISTPIYLKFPAFNIWGEGTQSLASVVAYTHTFTGSQPAPLVSLTATGGMFKIVLLWSFTPGQIDRDYIEIWAGTTNNRAAATLLTSVKNPTTSWTHAGLTQGQAWYYWARVVDTSGNDSVYFPSGATNGIYATASTDASALLTQLNNALGASQLTAGLNTRIDLIDTPTTGLVAKVSAANASIATINATLADIAGTPAYSASVTYAADTLVTYSGGLYQAKVSTLNHLPTDTTYWLKVGDYASLGDAVAGQAVILSNQDTRITAAEGSLTSVAGRATVLEAAVNSGTTGLATKASVAYVDTAKADAVSAAATASQTLVSTIKIGGRNLLRNSGDFTKWDAYYLKPTVTGGFLAPNGSLSAYRFETADGGPGGFSGVLTYINGPVMGPLVASVWLRCEAGTLPMTFGTDDGNTIAITVTTTWQKFVLNTPAGLPTTGNIRGMQFYEYTSGNTAWQAWGAQLETGTIATDWSPSPDDVSASISAAVATEATTRANADAAAATLTAQVQARLDTGDYAAVKTSYSAITTRMGAMEAKATVHLDVNGYVSGYESVNNGVTSSFTVLADKFLVAKPNGTGTPIPVFSLGTVNGSSAVGINGNLLIDGSVTAQQINARGLSIQDSEGNVILAAGTALAASYVTPAAGWLNSNVSLSGLGYNGSLEATSGGNLVKKSVFSDGNPGGWPVTASASGLNSWGKITFTGRDTFENNNEIPVTPGETIFISAYIDSTGCSTAGSVGLAVKDIAGNWVGWGVGLYPANTGWARYTAVQTIPATGVVAVPWFQLDGTITGSVSATRLYIGRTQEGATANIPDATAAANAASDAQTRANASRDAAVAAAAADANTKADAAQAAAIAVANTKLAKAGTDVMSGSVQLASAAAFWFGAGSTIDTDNGVYIGGGGMAARKSGAVTFAINQNGDAFFGGSLTANAVNAVNTINIADHAVTIPLAATSADTNAIEASNVSWLSCPTVTGDFQGAPVVLSMYALSDWSAVTGGSGAAEIDWRLLRDGTQIAYFRGLAQQNSIHTLSSAFVDYPAAGSHSYTVQYATSNSVGTTYWIRTPTLIAIGFRK